MLQFTCQVLSNDGFPINGMRVAYATSDCPHAFEGVSNATGVIGSWTQNLMQPSFETPDQDSTKCCFSFAVAEYFAPKPVPWSVINVDINLKTHLAHFVLLRCDSRSYSLVTWDYGPAPSLPRIMIQKRLVASPVPSPMKGVEYHHRDLGLKGQARKRRLDQLEDSDASSRGASYGTNPKKKARAARKPRRRRHSNRNRG
ncbi:hypothetical protein F5Y15DRAFT_379244 [Xylariaceae sp. FL0016]|nr:hypothetical protein F5Y15DRAFT_379244 [Xylariaceae sp. FL0016]